MWISPLVITPAKVREAKHVFDNLYYAANAHVYMDKVAGAPSLGYSLAGRLVATKSGWIVLEVPMALVRGAFDALHEPGAELPPAYSDYENYKAHISVMRPEELKDIGGVDKITERGHHFKYTLGPVQSVEPAGWSEMSKVWFIRVRSPELQKLRRSYGLSSKPHDGEFDFHITIGVRRKNVLRENDVAKAAATGGSGATEGASGGSVQGPSFSTAPDSSELPKALPAAIQTPPDPPLNDEAHDEAHDQGPTLPYAGKEAMDLALAFAKGLNEKRAAKRVELPVIGHYEQKGKIKRDAFLYQAPIGSNQSHFAECQNCHDFTGKSCENFPKGNTVKPTGSCGLFHYGKGSDKLLGDEMGVFTKEQAGYVEHPVRCENCAYFDDDEAYCELFEKLNEQFPSVFDLEKKVHKHGCCNAQIQRGRKAEEKETPTEEKVR